MDWNYLVYPAFAKSEGKISERALFTRNPLLPFCPRRRIGSRDVHSHDSRSGKAISTSHVSFGRTHSEIRGTAMRHTNS